MRAPRAGWLLAVVGVSVTPIAPAPRVAAPALTVQHQSGIGVGSDSIVFLPVRKHREGGSYATTGQLGRGRYWFVSTFPDDPEAVTGTGTARFVRSDGAVLTGTVTTTLAGGAAIDNIRVSYKVVLTHGTRELVGAKLTATGVLHNHLSPGPGEAGDEAFAFQGTSSVTTRVGYWMVDSAGTVYPFGGAQRYGNAHTLTAVHIEATASRSGYWIVDATGRVFAFGDARWLGNANAASLGRGEAVVSLSATPSGHGYWLFTNHGHVMAFGDTVDYGDLRSLDVSAATSPVVASASTPTGKGYYIVTSEGGVYHFGDAPGRGGVAGVPINRPIVGFVATPDDRGYWLVASDGGVFAFNVPFLGSMGATPLNQPVVGMVRYGTGYMLIARDGGIFDFSPQLFFGSLGSAPPARAITGGASAG